MSTRQVKGFIRVDFFGDGSFQLQEAVLKIPKKTLHTMAKKLLERYPEPFLQKAKRFLTLK